MVSAVVVIYSIRTYRIREVNLGKTLPICRWAHSGTTYACSAFFIYTDPLADFLSSNILFIHRIYGYIYYIQSTIEKTQNGYPPLATHPRLYYDFYRILNPLLHLQHHPKPPQSSRTRMSTPQKEPLWVSWSRIWQLQNNDQILEPV